jgi:isocitrate dehydrogenase (NAD+)
VGRGLCRLGLLRKIWRPTAQGDPRIDSAQSGRAQRTDHHAHRHGHRSINVAIRKAFDLFANVRPTRSLPGIPSRYSNVDIILVRENIEDTYAGVEYWQTPDVTESLRIITRPGSLMVIQYAFALARRLKRRKITCVHKANIHKTTDGLFLQVFREVAQDYPELEADDILIDNACLQLVTQPERFDVMILPNLFGDIVSDLCAGLVGGLGVAPGGNIGNGYAVFEAVHGSAPDIAGKGIANPNGDSALGNPDAPPPGAA